MRISMQEAKAIQGKISGNVVDVKGNPIETAWLSLKNLKN